MPGPAATPVNLHRARTTPALNDMVSQFAACLCMGPQRAVRGALGWYVDDEAPTALEAVAMAVPVPGQTLEEFLLSCDAKRLAARSLMVETRVDVMLDLCDVLQHLRSSGLVLLDLQPTNVALGDSTRDPYTGAAISLKHAYRVGAVLTEADVRALAAVYTAPPVRAGDVVQVGMDCWALGVLLWELVMGFKPVAGVQAAVRERGAHTDDAAASRNWMFATEAVTDTITHDTMTMLLLPSAAQRPSPAEVHHWLHSLKAQVASDMYQEMAAALADGTEMLEAADVDLGSSASLRREECAAACSAHVGEVGNDALVVEYQADRIGGTLSSLVVASPRACQEVTRAASLPQAQPRFPRWARRVGDKMKQAPVVAYAALVRCCWMCDHAGGHGQCCSRETAAARSPVTRAVGRAARRRPGVHAGRGRAGRIAEVGGRRARCE